MLDAPRFELMSKARIVRYVIGDAILNVFESARNSLEGLSDLVDFLECTRIGDIYQTYFG